jgi:cytochrome P450
VAAGECWDDADEFKPERFEASMVDFHGSSYEYLPFGAGRRMCPGIAYGIPVIEIVLVQLLYHFNWSLPDGMSELDMCRRRIASDSVASRRSSSSPHRSSFPNLRVKQATYAWTPYKD